MIEGVVFPRPLARPETPARIAATAPRAATALKSTTALPATAARLAALTRTGFSRTPSATVPALEFPAPALPLTLTASARLVTAFAATPATRSATTFRTCFGPLRAGM